MKDNNILKSVFSGIFLCFGLILITSFPAYAASSGRNLFEKYYCIDCHMIGGRGGTIGPNLTKTGKTKNLSWIKAQILHPGSHFVLGSEVKINGKKYLNRMPGFKSISETDLTTMALYIKKSASWKMNMPQTAVPNGLRIFREDNCISCHRINGVGGTVGPDLSLIGKNRTTGWIKTQILHPGNHYILGTSAISGEKAYVVIMPDFKNMPEGQLDILAKYLTTLK